MFRKAADLANRVGTHQNVARLRRFHGFTLPRFDGPVRIDQLDLTAHGNDGRILIEDGHGAGKKAACIAIIDIQEAEVFATCQLDTCIASRRRAAIALTDDKHVDRKFAHQGPAAFGGAIGRAIIDDDDFAFRVLVEDAAHAAFQMLGPIEAGDDDGNKGIVHGRSPLYPRSWAGIMIQFGHILGENFGESRRGMRRL